MATVYHSDNKENCRDTYSVTLISSPCYSLPAFTACLSPARCKQGRQAAQAGVICKILSFFLCLISISFIHAQEQYTRSITVIEELVETIARESEEELDYTTLLNDLTYYFENPLNLNTATYEELAKIHFLTDFQIYSLLQYIEEHGEFLSLNELSLVYGFNEEIIRKISPFIIVLPAEAEYREYSVKTLKYGNHQLFFRTSAILQEQQGYTMAPDSVIDSNPNARYEGSSLKLYTRYSFRYKDQIKAGYTGEKDAGESFLRHTNKSGFDFNSAYLQLRNFWKIKNLTVGDYQVRMGQGLSLWSGLAIGKSPDVLSIRKKSYGINGYTSTDENRFMRGVSATMSSKSLNITAFLSSKYVDANITSIDTIDKEILTFSSLQNSGRHAIPRETDDENAVRETILGGNITYNMEKITLGCTFIHYYFDANLIRDYDASTLFSFNGSKNTNFGFDYQLSLDKFQFFGEQSISSNKGLAFLNGTNMILSPRVTLSALHRLFQKDFQALYGNAFSENTSNTNEQGLYLGLNIDLYPGWSLVSYIDAFSFPWLKHHTTSPSHGYDYLIQTNYINRDKLLFYIRLKRESKPEKVIAREPDIDPVVKEKLTRLRFHFTYPVTVQLEFQDRIEISYFQKESSFSQAGYLAYHDILFKPLRFPLSFTFRYCMFDTEGYDSRIYAYEHDVLYAFSIPFFNDRGIRTYVNTKYSLSKYIDLWLKLSNTYYPDRETIGTGLNQIHGKNKTELRFQVRVKF